MENKKSYISQHEMSQQTVGIRCQEAIPRIKYHEYDSEFKECRQNNGW